MNHLENVDKISLCKKMSEKVGKWIDMKFSVQNKDGFLVVYIIKSGFPEIFQEVTAIRFSTSFINLMCWKGCLQVENAKQRVLMGI